MKRFLRPILLLFVLVLCSACASTGTGETPGDPFESVNRVVFKFNDRLDKAVLAPVARGYDFITPRFMQRGLRNFFANLYDINGALNALVQARLPGAARNTGRFLVNSTLGMLGFVDVASEMGIAPYRTDFGHTLSIWGASSGPYLMVPLFGPRTVRSGTASIVDSVASLQWQLDPAWAYGLFALEIIDGRSALSDAEGLITGDRYIFIRDAYLQQREYFVNEGVVDDAFSSDSDDDFDWD